jgi:hypothetical protein
LRGGHGRVGVAAGPGLDAGVDVQRSALAAQAHELGAGHVDRQVHQEITRCEPALQLGAEVLRSEGHPVVADPQLLGFLAGAVVGRDDADLPRADVQMTQNQWQHPAADAAAAHHDHPAAERGVFDVISHPALPKKKSRFRQPIIQANQVGPVRLHMLQHETQKNPCIQRDLPYSAASSSGVSTDARADRPPHHPRPALR